MQFLQGFARKQKQAVPNYYHVAEGDIFLPGAGNAVFLPTTGLPPLQLIGHGIYAGPSPSPIQPQLVYANQTAPVSGIGGVVAGQLINQPLQVPDTTNGSE